MRTSFFRAVDAVDKAAVLLAAIRSESGSGIRRFDVDIHDFQSIPRSPFAYWVSPQFRRLFLTLDPVEARGRVVKVGVQTFDDFRFLRLSWEGLGGRSAKSLWVPFAKGGTLSRYYADLPLAIEFADAGKAISVFKYQHRPREGYLHRAADYYFRGGMTWPRRTQVFGPRVLPRGCIFAEKGPSLFALGDDAEQLAVLGVLASKALDSLVAVSLNAVDATARSFEVGIIQSTPFPTLSDLDEAALAALARRAWSLKRSLDTRTETSHAFVLPALLQMQGPTLAARSATWTEHVQVVEAEITAIQAEIDERCFTLYGIDEEDRRAITEGFGASSPDAEAAEEEGDTDAEDEAEAEAAAAADTATLAAELVSWATGVAFGRFDVRLATGARELPVEPEPFDPLPVCSPAMLTGDDDLPLSRPPAGYPLTFPEDGILVDDPGHPRDVTAAVRAVFDTVFDTSADAVWQEAAALLDPKGHDLRTWLAKDFFGHHLARHSKSRRKAPILWQLGTPSGRYSTWCYAHRLTRDSLFALSRDVVAPKLALEERRQSSLVQEAGPNPTAKQRAEIAAQDALVAELRVFADEVRRVAPLWNPDLDDGIVLVEAPLWRLVPHKAWAKELKARWDDLAAGKYDWAYLAMHLWPERVVPKCATDRSLAIAHGLEDVFWAEGADGKWAKRPRPTRSVEDLVAERTSDAVKAALADLLAAPAPAAGGRGRGRKGE